jgi:hypothetical protein
MSPLGLIRHLADVERRWFRRLLAQADAPPLYWSDDVEDGTTVALRVLSGRGRGAAVIQVLLVGVVHDLFDNDVDNAVALWSRGRAVV